MGHSTQDLLKAWTVIEVLSPQASPEKTTVEEGRLILSVDEDAPWLNPRRHRTETEKSLYWLLYLGGLDLAKANAIILDKFPDDQGDERKSMKGQSPLAILVLDEQGVLVGGKGTLSSYAWGVGQLRLDKLDHLARFSQDGAALLDTLKTRLVVQDKHKNIKPLQSLDIRNGLAWLRDELNLTQDLVSEEWQSLRIGYKKANAEPPEPDILNSFFLEELIDVGKALGKGETGPALKAYLKGEPHAKRQDVVREQSVLERLIKPRRFPLARWPSRGRHSLFLMQQAAVNHAIDDLQEGGLTAVNGPPGTGKTTLLRDMIAAIVSQRAVRLSKYEDPAKAFLHRPVEQKDGTKDYRYLLKPDIMGFEIVVASSNNNAVDNISREIPSIKALADDFDPPLQYFSYIADQLMGAEAPKERQAEFAGSCWGLVSASTGNAKKRSAFFDILWWKNLKEYLWAVDGKNPYKTAFEQPPATHQAALEIWQKTREEFKEKLKRVADLIDLLDSYQDGLKKLGRFTAALQKSRKDAAQAAGKVVGLQNEIEPLRARLALAESDLGALLADRTAVMAAKPGMLARFQRAADFGKWQRRLLKIQTQIDHQRGQQDTFKTTLQSLEVALQNAEGSRATLQAAVDHHAKRLADEKARLDSVAPKAGSNVPAGEFWTNTEEALQKSSPWSSEALNHARDDLFAASFRLHKAFIDAAAKPIRSNLAMLIKTLPGGFAGIPAEMRQSLWSTLFLVVPVLSTTFASFGRQFAGLGQEQLGWLLIDEAGQAVPQAAVGALWRSRRAMIIGDPLQIEPVTALPNRLTAGICLHHGIEAERWAAPWASAQSLADSASWLGAELKQEERSIWVGSPLRVHRRCEDPMFAISNNAAYGGLMVQATPPASSPIGQICGDSCWFAVDSASSGKWSEEEGHIVIDLIGRLFNAGIAPDIFVITPFRQVADGMRRAIRSRFAPEVVHYLKDRIGTVHTFQGKEAEAVIFLLGAPGQNSAGARRWAGSKVNLLNVAVTRAKRRLYVVGSDRAWAEIPFFDKLAVALPTLKR